MAARSSAEEKSPSKAVVARRSAGYQPSSWDYHSLQMLLCPSKEKENDRVIQELTQELRQKMNGEILPVRRFELIEAVCRLGLAPLFLEEICQALGIFDVVVDDDDKSNFTKRITDDASKVLSLLYYGSDMACDDEKVMDATRLFSIKNMIAKKKVSYKCHDKKTLMSMNDSNGGLRINQKMSWLEARKFIDSYEHQHGMIPALLHLAKLHFNHVQAIHQKDLKQVGSWWTRLGIGRTINFSRDRLMECFFFVVGIVPYPEHGICREELTKVGMMIATIDDVYDLYGSLEELELFTQIICRWNIKDLKKLPKYMRICFSTLNDITNEVANHLPFDDRSKAIPCIKKVWADLLKSFLVEAKWYRKGHYSTLKDYLSNASISISGHVILLHVYILMRCKITEDVLQKLQCFPDIIRLPSLIFRLWNDLSASSMEHVRDEGLTSIQCYMKETGASEKEARRHVKTLIDNAWKDMNGALDSSFPPQFVDASVNLARTASFLYQNGDGFSAPGREMKDSVRKLFMNRISI